MFHLGYFLDFLSVLIVLFALFLCYFNIYYFIRSVNILRKKPLGHIDKSTLPGVSILKPLRGADGNLHVNLESFFTMDYPKFELIFCIEDHDDPALKIVKNLIEKYPKIDAQYVITFGHKVGMNPKINNMNPGYEIAKYDLVMISDDKILINYDTLLDMVDCMTEDVGIVNQIPFYPTDQEGLEAMAIKMSFTTGATKYFFLLEILQSQNMNGMSSLFRKKLVDSAGGLKFFGKAMSEDLKIVEAIQKLGYKLAAGRQIVLQNPEQYSINHQFNRQVRWESCNQEENFLTKTVKIFMHPLLVSLMIYWALDRHLGGVWNFNIIFIVLAVYSTLIAFDYFYWIFVMKEKFSIMNTIKFILIWVCGTLFVVGVITAAFLNLKKLEWKGQEVVDNCVAEC